MLDRSSSRTYKGTFNKYFLTAFFDAFYRNLLFLVSLLVWFRYFGFGIIVLNHVLLSIFMRALFENFFLNFSQNTQIMIAKIIS